MCRVFDHQFISYISALPISPTRRGADSTLLGGLSARTAKRNSTVLGMGLDGLSRLVVM